MWAGVVVATPQTVAQERIAVEAAVAWAPCNMLVLKDGQTDVIVEIVL